MTDREFAEVIAASDIIALPYRKKFNGASGPLVEGVYLGKCIIGPNHGNLGKLFAIIIWDMFLKQKVLCP